MATTSVQPTHVAIKVVQKNNMNIVYNYNDIRA